MVRSVMDVTASSSQPNFPLTGGGYYNTSGFQTGANLEGIDATVIDNRASGSTALTVGKLFVEQFLAANTGDASYTVNTVANQAIPWGSFGIMTGVPQPLSAPTSSTSPTVGQTTGGGTEIRIRQKGSCLAFCTSTANANKAIVVGDPLAADGAGNLTSSIATPAVGTVLAIAKGALAGATATPTLVLVNVGGY